ncbi:MAG: DUF1015 family protein [Gaiellaceae bacterium]
MATVKPFSALLYDTAVAGPLERLVAPPYDVLSAEQRDRYRALSPYNVVNLTLSDDEAESGPRFRGWLEEGALSRDERPALWWLEQQFIGPDGIERTRSGVVASIRVEPYERRVVLPHERTHQGPKDSRLRLLRAVRAELEPIFLLYDAPDRPELALQALASAEPDLEATDGAVRSRLWRIVDEESAERFAAALRDSQLLIADGHHRYETALAFHEQDGSEESAWTMAALVNTHSEGLAIFPTHRVFERAPAHDRSAGDGQQVEAALRRLELLPVDRPWVLEYDREGTSILGGGEPILDVEWVDRLGHEGISYTPSWQEAVGAVDSGAAELAVLMRPPRIEQVFAYAREGRVMPQKSTYFYPKLLSGLLFHPL